MAEPRRGLFSRSKSPAPRVKVEALKFEAQGTPTSRISGADGEVFGITEVDQDDLLGIYRQVPLYRKGVNKHSGDLVREWVRLEDGSGNRDEAKDKEFQRWAEDIELRVKERLGIMSAHIYGDGVFEFVWDDDGKPNTPVPVGATLEDVQVLDPRITTLTLKRDETTGRYRTGAKHRPPGRAQILFHPDRVRHIKLNPIPGEIPGVSTAEAAYHLGMSSIQSDQSLGEIVRHQGPGFKWAKVVDDDQKTIDELRESFKAKTLLRGLATGKNVEMVNFSASGLDVTSFYDAFYIGLAAALGMDVAMLKGVEAGAVTGSETNRANYQADLRQVREDVLNPLNRILVDGRFPGLDVPFAWNPFPQLESEVTRSFRERASGVQSLVLAGVPLSLALRESGIEITDKELKEFGAGAPPVNGLLDPNAAASGNPFG